MPLSISGARAERGIMKAEDILNHECLFFQHNAACHFYVEDDEDCVKKAERNTVFDFASMFDFSDVTNGLTSDVQAEIMCVGQIPVNEIDSVVFNSEETASAFRSKLEENEILPVSTINYSSKHPIIS